MRLEALDCDEPAVVGVAGERLLEGVDGAEEPAEL